MVVTSNSELETRNIGNKLAQELHGGDIMLLHGDLGAGKTAFAKGLAEGLGVHNDIVSPTFTLMNVYGIQNAEFRMPRSEDGAPPRRCQNFVHIDTYRLDSEKQLIDIGAEDYIGDASTVCVIEWPEKIANLLRDKKTLNVYIEHVNDTTRRITLEKSS